MNRVAVNTHSQIEVGSYYLIKGKQSKGLPIPPQVAKVLSKPTRTVLGGHIVKVMLFVSAGKGMPKIEPINTYLVLESVSVNGGTDLHLEKVGDHIVDMAKKLAEPNEYPDIAKEKPV